MYEQQLPTGSARRLIAADTWKRDLVVARIFGAMEDVLVSLAVSYV